MIKALLRSAVIATVLLGTLAHADLINPLNSSLSSIPEFIAGVLKAVVMVALPIITLFIVYAGFKFVSARGNPGGITEAKENFKWVIIGAILILAAWVLATLIAGTVTQLVRG